MKKRKQPVLREGRWIVIYTRGYCRKCWKRFEVSNVDAGGMTLQDIQEAVRVRLRCCTAPDPRLSA